MSEEKDEWPSPVTGLPHKQEGHKSSKQKVVYWGRVLPERAHVDMARWASTLTSVEPHIDANE